MAVTLFQTAKSFAQFLANWTLKGGHMVDQNTANMRAAICLGCHNNQAGSDPKTGGACRSCRGKNKVLDAIFGPLLKGRTTPYDAKLKDCALCGCKIHAMVHFPNDYLLTKEDANAYPSFCFKKAILEDKEI